MLRLKQVLIDRNIAQRQLALKMGVSPTTISKLVIHNQWCVSDIAKF
ncbi:helix-turn-helix domain-containing protein, partial [Muribacter muris]